MESPQEENSLVIGVGNRSRSDDSAGCVIVDKLSKIEDVPAACIVHNGEPGSLIESWQGYQTVIIVDAMQSGQKPGSILRFLPISEALPADSFEVSTHGFGVPQAIELARAMDRLPPKLVVLGIEGKCFEYGTEVSADVEHALESMVAAVLAEITE